jgi:TonB family protein
MLRTRTAPNNLILLTMILAAAASVIILHHQQDLIKTGPVFYNETTYVSNTAYEARTDRTAVARSVELSKVMPVPPVKTDMPLPLIPPKIIARIMPEYPSSALKQGIGGTVVMSVFIGSSGTPERVEKKASSGYDALDEAAERSVSLWKFEPAKRGSQTIASWFEIPVVFKIK